MDKNVSFHYSTQRKWADMVAHYHSSYRFSGSYKSWILVEALGCRVSFKASLDLELLLLLLLLLLLPLFDDEDELCVTEGTINGAGEGSLMGGLSLIGGTGASDSTRGCCSFCSGDCCSGCWVCDDKERDDEEELLFSTSEASQLNLYLYRTSSPYSCNRC